MIAAATYDETLLWLGVALLLLGLIVQAIIWWAARNAAQRAKDTPKTEDVVDKLIEAIIKLIEKGLLGVAISLVGLALIVAAVFSGDDDSTPTDTTTTTLSANWLT
jgi:hypothetical protein